MLQTLQKMIKSFQSQIYIPRMTKQIAKNTLNKFCELNVSWNGGSESSYLQYYSVFKNKYRNSIIILIFMY